MEVIRADCFLLVIRARIDAFREPFLVQIAVTSLRLPPHHRRAGFLRAQGEGEELIESLTSDTLDSSPVRATEVKETTRAEVQKETTDKVVEGLTTAAPEPESKGTEVSRTVERPRVDQSMIDDLIEGVGSSDDEGEPGA